MHGFGISEKDASEYEPHWAYELRNRQLRSLSDPSD